MLPEGYSPVWSDIVRNVWIIRNPYDQPHQVEVLPYSVPTIYCVGSWDGMAVKWEDVRG